MKFSLIEVFVLLLCLSQIRCKPSYQPTPDDPSWVTSYPEENAESEYPPVSSQENNDAYEGTASNPLMTEELECQMFTREWLRQLCLFHVIHEQSQAGQHADIAGFPLKKKMI